MEGKCLNCGAVFKIDASKIPDKGVYARCTKCQTRLFLIKHQGQLKIATASEPDTGVKKNTRAKKKAERAKLQKQLMEMTKEERKQYWAERSVFKFNKTNLVTWAGIVVAFGVAGAYVFWTEDWKEPPKPRATSTYHPPVANNAWNSGVYQVKSYLKRNLKDPGSLDVIEWSPVAKRSDGGYQVRCKYRAKNSFGGYVISNQVFVMDSNGNVLTVYDY